MKKKLIAALAVCLVMVLVVEDITGTHADPYHYELHFHTEFPVTVDVKP